MLNSQPDDQIEKEADPQSVEDNWQELLVDNTEDVDQETAEQIIRSLQSHPTLAFGDPSIEQTQTLIEGALDKIDLLKYGLSDSESERLKRLMREELREGLAGNRIGPMALTTPAHTQVKSEIAPPPTANSAGNDPENSTSSDDSDDSDGEVSPQAGDTDIMSVDPSEVGTTGGAAAPNAVGAVPDIALRDHSADTSDASDSLQAVDINPDEDLKMFTARAVVRQIQQQHLSEDSEPSEKLLQLIMKAAELGAYQHQQFMKTRLFGHLDENAQDIVFNQTMLEPIKDEIAKEVKQMDE